ncbi:MAG: hypothetical protein JO219_12610 [Candidatus Eremiobacteraeota bacterium]|nr:hypothetical protein [Candidatus Eremiobacteraeota bacterium]
MPPDHYAQYLDCSSYALAVIRKGTAISSSFLTNGSKLECDYIFQTAVPVNESLTISVSRAGQKQWLPAVTVPNSFAGKTTPPFYQPTATLPF